MGGKSGGDSQVNSGGMPEWARNAHTDLMARANVESKGRFKPYTGARVSGDNENSVLGRNAIIGGISGTNDTMDQGVSGFSGLTSGTNDNMQGGTASTLGGLQAASNLKNYDPGKYAEFNSAAAQQYMSPYQQAVTDVGKRNAVSDYQMANIQRNSDMVSRGAFGGSRQAMIQSQADKALSQQLSDMQVKGLQDSYMNAQSQFGADRDAREAAFAANTDVDTTRMNAYMQGGDQLFNQGSTQFGNQMDANKQLYDAGSDIYGNQMDAGNAVYKMGKDAEAKDQAQVDADYQDYLTGRDWSKNQMGWYSGIMTGAAPGFTNYTGESATGNTASNMLGLGATAIGALGDK